MEKIECNGWTNRATWLVNAWFEPQSKAEVDMIMEQIQEEYDKLSDFFQDLICIEDINWKELRDYFEDEEDEEDIPVQDPVL